MHIRFDWEAAAEKGATRDGFGKGVVEAGHADQRVVVLSADLAESTRADGFRKEFPHRFIEMGVAEQNLATVSAGMATYGKIPFFTSYAAFSPGRNWEQIRTTIALNNVHAVVCGMHAGISVGPDGATHQMLEDIAIMRAMPNMIVISPCDVEEGRKATLAAAKAGKPVYMRFGREKTPMITTAETPFEMGKANVLMSHKAPYAALFATGPLVHTAMRAAVELEKLGYPVSVTNIHTIKPIDRETIVREATLAQVVVTVEEHQTTGGLGSAVAEVLVREAPVPMEMIGVQNMFGQSGTPDELYTHYGMDVAHIVEATKKVISRK